MNVSALLLALFLPLHAFAQGYAGLGSLSEGFATPKNGYQLQFPRDHAAHPDFRIEWWYVTANLTDNAGNPMGLQWTLFRQAAQAGATGTGWQDPQIWMGHAGLTLAGQHFSAEKFARGGIGQAGIHTGPFQAYIDDWDLAADGPNLEQVHLSASGVDFSYDVDLTATGPLILHGDNGYSVKSAQGQASYYYSQPYYEVSGQVIVDGQPVAVTGNAWLDREWSSQPLAADQTGWDWFSLHFDDNVRLMAFRLRGDDNYTSGTWIAPNGETTPLPNGALKFTPLEVHNTAGRDVPVRWRVELPERGVDVITSAINPDAYMNTLFPYWEGPIVIEGSHSGVGYLEMTGY